ncbi:acetate--CoA ligase [Fulvivirga sp. 29W222]|uniref:Acetate--CoA ligase n=1 Tax=Fulvivirga marina TaxID=2494733 RepID=A0A937G061_9BACT|nr:acetate--CoA ligase [Fulvivirga marina]MBL6448077.1 acetate--CoA ligase [Fulvivirga marina]
MPDLRNKTLSRPNLADYERLRKEFFWEEELRQLDPHVKKHGLNIAYEAIDKHCEGPLENHTALRWIQKEGTIRDYSYGELKSLTASFANLLQKLGVKKGETVYSLIGRVPALYIAALGTLKYTAVFCPLFSVFGPEPILQRLKSGNVRVLVTTKALFDKKVKTLLNDLPELKYILLTDIEEDPSDHILSLSKHLADVPDVFEIPFTEPETPALLHFTSGTTGMPKGALHVHEAVLMHYVTGKYVLDFQPGDIFWCTADPGWVTGTSYGIIAPLVNGVTNIVDEEEFDVTRWYTLLQDQKVNVWYTAPTAIRRLMRANFMPVDKYDLEHLRLILSVGEPLNPEAVTWGEKAFGVPVLDNWWQTETGGIIIANYRSMEVKPGSMGKPLPGIKAAIAEIIDNKFTIIDEPGKQGHLVLKRGWPSMFRSYLHQEERYNKSFHGDWYISGDLAKQDEDGYFWFVGRADDIIKTSGHMVGPFEVESCLMEHPAVAESAVIGKPDSMIRELVKAFVVLKIGFEANDELRQDILGHARKKLGPAIAPKEIEFTESLPKTRSGKIMRRLLKAREMGVPEGDTSTLE